MKYLTVKYDIIFHPLSDMLAWLICNVQQGGVGIINTRFRGTIRQGTDFPMRQRQNKKGYDCLNHTNQYRVFDNECNKAFIQGTYSFQKTSCDKDEYEECSTD